MTSSRFEPTGFLVERPRGVPVWLLAFAGFFLLGGAWALAAPYDGTPDEADHAYRAVGVASGGWIAREGRFQSVPQSLLSSRCFAGMPTHSANCGRQPGGDATRKKTGTTAGRYNPLYYATVGWPLRLWPNWTGILLARLVSSALVAVLLGAALHSALEWSRSPLFGAGILVATTPMTMHLAGAINPNAIEIAAGTALFAALIPAWLGEPAVPRPAELWVAGAAGAVLAIVRAFGPLWLAVVLAVLLIPPRRPALARWRRDHRAWTCAAAVALALVVGVGWTWFAKTGKVEIVNLPNHMAFSAALRFEIALRVGGYAQEMVGIMAWLDAPMPGWVYIIWWSALGFLVVAVLAFGRWVDRWRITVLIVISFGIPVFLDAIEVNTYGFVSQGRYVLPIAVGIPMISSFALFQREVLSRQQGASILRTFALLLLPLHLACLAFTMVRWQSGTILNIDAKTANPLAGSWHPPLGSIAPLLAACGGLVLLGACCWHSAPARASRDARH